MEPHWKSYLKPSSAIKTVQFQVCILFNHEFGSFNSNERWNAFGFSRQLPVLFCFFSVSFSVSIILSLHALIRDAWWKLGYSFWKYSEIQLSWVFFSCVIRDAGNQKYMQIPFHLKFHRGVMNWKIREYRIQLSTCK